MENGNGKFCLKIWVEMRGNLQTLALILIMELRLVGLCVRNGEHDEFVPMLNSIKPVMWFEAFPYYVSMVT